MNEISQEHASFLLQYLLPSVKNEHRTTRSVIEAIPDSNSDYRPDPHGKTAMEIAWHIVASEQRFYTGIVTGAFDFAPIHKPDDVKTAAQIGAWYEASFAKYFDALTKLNGEQLVKSLDFRGVIQRPAVTWISAALHHSVHHRGQLSTYLRAMGGKVPAIYGESFDSAEAKKAAGR
jgi:uncharacterized damage-inducible protein DinB